MIRKLKIGKCMKRRNFLLLGSMLGVSPYLHAKPSSSFERSFKKVERTIAAVQEHMFPAGSKIPSAQSMNTLQFLFDTVNHKSYDKDIRKFVIEGAEELIEREKAERLGKIEIMMKMNKFLNYEHHQKTT